MYAVILSIYAHEVKQVYNISTVTIRYKPTSERLMFDSKRHHTEHYQRILTDILRFSWSLTYLAFDAQMSKNRV